jgi:nitrilase
MDSRSDKKANIDTSLKLMKECLKDNPDIICLPEKFLFWGTRLEIETPSSPAIEIFKDFAKENSVNVILGSVELDCGEKNRVTNTSFVIDRAGDIIYRYDKIYMYTVHRKDLVINEEKRTKRGGKLGILELEGVKIGIGICFDLRFPEYFRKLAEQGAEIIFLPSSFRKTTGQIAWNFLPNARAIENQAYFCACNQTGDEGLKARCGNSKIISYSGEIIVSLAEEEGYISADLDIDALREYKKEMPVPIFSSFS